MTKFSLESVALVGLGARIGCMEDNLPKDHPGPQLMECAKGILDLNFKLTLMPKILQKFYTGTFDRLIKIFDTQWE